MGGMLRRRQKKSPFSACHRLFKKTRTLVSDSDSAPRPAVIWLQSDKTSKLGVLGLVDHAHTAAAQFLDHAIM
jgi:hypothetical protein